VDAVMLEYKLRVMLGLIRCSEIPTEQWSCRLPSRRHSSIASPNPPARRIDE